MLAIDISVWKKANMIDQHERKDLNEEASLRRRTMLISLMVLGIVIAAIAGGWYLLQPSGEGSQVTERQITIFTISNLSLTTLPVDEHPGILAPNFSLTDPNGNSSWLSDFRGKVVVLDFMATWCGPCRQEMPHYGTIWEKYENRIVLMSIDVDPTESAETLRSFAQEFPYATWIWARDTVNLIWAYQITGIPKTVIIDQDGYIRFAHTGVTHASTFIEEIDQLLG